MLQLDFILQKFSYDRLCLSNISLGGFCLSTVIFGFLKVHTVMYSWPEISRTISFLSMQYFVFNTHVGGELMTLPWWGRPSRNPGWHWSTTHSSSTIHIYSVFMVRIYGCLIKNSGALTGSYIIVFSNYDKIVMEFIMIPDRSTEIQDINMSLGISLNIESNFSTLYLRIRFCKWGQLTVHACMAMTQLLPSEI